MGNLDQLLDIMWKDYVSLNPQAQKIVDCLKNEGEVIVNDHIALRTYNLPETNISVVEKAFLDQGYTPKGEYHFEEKKLFAKHYEHSNPAMPKVFISELLVEKFSPNFQKLIKNLVKSVDMKIFQDARLMVKGRPWNISLEDYENLLKESDYGAWVAAIGFRPNHFTIFINELKKYSDILDLNAFLKDKGFKLNDSGGEIKGSKEVYLEQSSTLADNIEVSFSNGKKTIPSCYFEFAKRYPLENGKLYQGFVAKSADKIFESTNKGQ